MYFIEDENVAWRLQNELQAYENFKHQKEGREKENLNPVDSKLEYIDPTPNIHDLFVKFDRKFFWNTLGMVEVVWSSKMTKCAGVCSFEGGRGLCKIALSAPLLSLRPRKDLVETLLHEMIHAYLFVTHNYKDREDHGPEFHKHMFRINKEAGTKITVYHTFFDEVEYYQRHIWRCNGPCQNKKPYFGFLRRAVNRSPGPNDPWWKQHQAECGGTYIKISEPEKKLKKSEKIILVKPGNKHRDIRDYFKKNITSKTGQNKTKTSNIKTLADLKEKVVTGVKTNMGTNTIIISNAKKEKNSNSKNSNTQNSLKDLMKNKTRTPVVKDLGKKKTLKKESFNQDKDLEDGCQKTKDIESDKVKEMVRSVWANKYTNSKPPQPENFSPKKIKLHCHLCSEGFSEDEIENHLNGCLQSESKSEKYNKDLKAETSITEKPDELKECPVCSKKVLESEINDHLETCLKCSFVDEKDDEIDIEVTCESVPCPCCYRWFQEREMNSHIDECLTLNTLKEEILAS